MIVTIRGESHECRTATMEEGKVTLYLGEYDEHGDEITSVFIGFSADEIDGIEEEEKPTHEERIAELEESLEMILSGVTE